MIALVIPALNEGEVIGEVVRSIPRLVEQIIVVDNGSTDHTAKRAEEAGALVVAEPVRGYGRACRAGMKSRSRCYRVHRRGRQRLPRVSGGIGHADSPERV
jgi:glycosyltransferase involved in cell wall biosynthesis